MTLDDEAYPVKLVELWFPGRVDVVNLTGLLASQRFSFWWEWVAGVSLLVKVHVEVTGSQLQRCRTTGDAGTALRLS